MKDYERIAKEKLDYSVYGYYSAGADDEVTLRHNKRAFENILIYPRVLRDMSHVSMKSKILGMDTNIPFGIAPAAMQKLIHPEGELLAAK